MAAASKCWFDLRIYGSPRLPRELRIKVTANQVFVWMCAQLPDFSPLVYASAYSHEWRIETLSTKHSLWLKTTAFELNPEEAAQVSTLLRSCFPSAEPIGPAPAKEATAAADLLPGGDRGTTPPPVCTGGGALDSYDHFVARFLTAGECY